MSTPKICFISLVVITPALFLACKVSIMVAYKINGDTVIQNSLLTDTHKKRNRFFFKGYNRCCIQEYPQEKANICYIMPFL